MGGEGSGVRGHHTSTAAAAPHIAMMGGKVTAQQQEVAEHTDIATQIRAKQYSADATKKSESANKENTFKGHDSAQYAHQLAEKVNEEAGRQLRAAGKEKEAKGFFDAAEAHNTTSRIHGLNKRNLG